LDPRTGFPLNCRTPPLLGANGHYTVHDAQTPTLAQSPVPELHRPSSWGSGSPRFVLLLACRASYDGRCDVVRSLSLVIGVAFSAAALRLRQLLPAPPIPRASTARPRSPRASVTAYDPLVAPPRGVGLALPGRRISPASAASLSYSARSPFPPAPEAAPILFLSVLARRARRRVEAPPTQVPGYPLRGPIG